MNSKTSCAIVTITIGREFSINNLLDYFKNLTLPLHISECNLYFILGCDTSFIQLLKNKIQEFDLENKYGKITFIEGNRRCHSNLDWSEWEQYTRKKDTLIKHNSALQNINIGLSSIKKEDYIHFVDDDTIPPYNALVDLFKTYNKVDKCGIASGIYFNKEWLGPTAVTESDELKRRIVASTRKDKWIETSIDDLAVSDFTDIGFVGNGCMLISREDTQKILPLTEDRDVFDTGAPPDSKICHRIRLLGKKISTTPSVICKHLDNQGKEVGLSGSYIESIKHSGIPKKILFGNFNPFLDYSKLSKEFDKIIITTFRELNKLKYRKKLNFINTLENIYIVQKSIEQKVAKYGLDKKEEDTNILFTFHEIYKFMEQETSYSIFVYRNGTNDIVILPILNSGKLRDFLNTQA